MKKLLLVLAMGLGFASTSHADIMVEPYLGYEMGKGSTAADDYKFTASDLGIRLGYHSPLMLWAALDYTMGSGTADFDATGKEDLKRTTLSGVVGLDFPILLRAWIGYGFTNEFKLDDTKWTGKSTKVGIGFTGLPFVSLNLEMIKDEFNDSDVGGIDPKADDTSYLVSVSLPLNF